MNLKAIFPFNICCNFSYKIYSKMWESWMHLNFDHLYIPLTSK